MTRRDSSHPDIAEERIELLYRFAREVFEKNPSLAKRYIEIARLIGMRCRVRIPRELKRFTCKECGSLLVPGANCRVRTRPQKPTMLVMTCLICGKIKRYPMSTKNTDIRV